MYLVESATKNSGFVNYLTNLLSCELNHSGKMFAMLLSFLRFHENVFVCKSTAFRRMEISGAATKIFTMRSVYCSNIWKTNNEVWGFLIHEAVGELIRQKCLFAHFELQVD